MEKKETDRIYDWSVQFTGNYHYPKKDENAKSCFDLHDGIAYIEEYGFETITELKRKLEDLWLSLIHI